MNRILFYIPAILLAAFVSSCSKTEGLLYNDIARVQLSDTATLNYTFIYESGTVSRDTIYIQVNTIGGITSYDREVKLVQVPEYDYTYVRDPVTNLITDTVVTERPNKAVPGVHYVSFDDLSVRELMVIKANQPHSMIPVILLRDASLKENSYRLRVELVANNEFGLGEARGRARTVVFSDRLERFYSWRVDAVLAPAYNTFGKYSTRKHQFMVDVLEQQIDEDWYQAIMQMQAQQHYKNVLKQALNDFNNDPVNVASGAAPMRETDNPDSPLITFPN